MTKTFTCRELGGICDEKFSGSSFPEIMHKAAEHMMSDDAHKQKMMSMGGEGGESREEWFTRKQGEFDQRQED